MIPKSISKKSDARLAAEKLIADARAVEGGTRALRDAALSEINTGGDILPREAGETERMYRSRVRTSSLDYNPYEDELRRSIGGIMEHGIQLGAFEPTSGVSPTGEVVFNHIDDVPPCIHALWEDIDRQGTHGDVFFTRFLEDAIRGVAICFVDYWSARDERKAVEAEGRGWTAADDAAHKVRPYFIRIPVENVIAAKEGVMLRYWDNLEVLDPETFEIKVTKRIRVIEPGRYRLAVEENGNWVWREDSRADNTPFTDTIPVVALTFKPLEGEWALGAPYYQQLADATISLFRAYSALERAVIKSVLALYFGKLLGKKITEVDGQRVESNPDARDFQHLALVLSDNPQSDLRLIESSGSSVTAVEGVVKSRRDDADRHRTSKMKEGGVSTASATRAMIDDSDAKAPHTQVRRGLEDAIEKCLTHIRNWAVLAHWEDTQFAGRTDGGSVFVGKALTTKNNAAPATDTPAQAEMNNQDSNP